MIKTILVDDEQDSIDILLTLLHEECPDVEIINTAKNALEAISCINRDKPDLVFLDIQMPGYNGLEVLKNLGVCSAMIVFTTAHKDYAIEALRHGAYDYLLKPIAISELKNCLTRVREKLTGRTTLAPNPRYGIIELSVKEGSIFIKPTDIIRLEASGSYTLYFLENGVRHIISKGLGECESELDARVFYRCHRKHVINLNKVRKFHYSTYDAELSDNSRIEVARKNKDEFIEKLKRLEL